MNYGKAQQVLKSKFPTMYHKYSFRGEIRTYRNQLTNIDESIVKYRGTTTRFVDHWNNAPYKGIEKVTPVKTLTPRFEKVIPLSKLASQTLNSNSDEYFVYLVRGEKQYYKIHKEFTDPDIKFLGVSSLPGKATISPPRKIKKSDPAKIAIRKEASKLAELQHLLRINIKDHEYKCCYCGISLTKKNYTKDHIIPIDRGGTNELKNLKPCCEACNVEKGNMMLHTYIQWLNLLQGSFKVGSKEYITTQTKIINANELAKSLSPPAQD